MTLSETEEELRQLSWQMRISRDEVLKTAEVLPPELHDRVDGMAERLIGLSAHLREMMALLPSESAGLPEPVRVDGGLDGLRLSVSGLAAEVSWLMNALNQFSAGLGYGKGSIVH